ncbi:uncharacterized protein LOC115415499 [Sphaeramia orbicularis]|uniref:uncharacterized protein LOC115415499 n=1 Tax=Sphaeramia orbicularis TaxID=375764 RepID=UPI00117D8E0D|nr:uncharacterized protein LOC115415499 [Sphaeramia orbicularis]
MMVENKQIKMSSSLLLMLQITVATGGISSVVRRGDDAMLSCTNLNVHDCGQIGFIFTVETDTTELVQRGQIQENRKVTTDRLRMTADCSLVIKEVIPEDAGLYDCQQNHHQQVEYTENWLSVVSINKEEVDEKIALTCSVSTYVQCKHPVKWLYEENEVTRDNKNIRLSQVVCWSTVTFKKSINTESFTCKVEDKNTGNIHLFPFRPRSSGGDTTKPAVESTEEQMTTPASETRRNKTNQVWIRFFIGFVGLTALSVTAVVLPKWMKRKRNNSQISHSDVTVTYRAAASSSSASVSINPDDFYENADYGNQ